MAPEIAAASIAQAIQLVVALQGPPTPIRCFRKRRSTRLWAAGLR